MKSVCLTGAPKPDEKILGQVSLVDEEMPEVGPEDVLIRVAYASICGSDTNILKGNVPQNLLDNLSIVLQFQPFHLGHEISGVIEAVGNTAATMGFKVGDRVTSNYIQYCNTCYWCRTGQENFCEHPKQHMDGMSEYVCWHMSQVHKIPDDVSLLNACQTEPLSISMNATETVGIRPGSRVFVSGTGAIGLYAIQFAKRSGASLIVASDIVEDKQKRAIENGADYAVNPLEEGWEETAMAYTGGLGFDAVLEASGAPSAADAALRLTSKNGHVCYFAMYPPTWEMKVNPYNELYEGSKHIHGMYTSADMFPRTVAMLPKMELGKVIDKVMAPEDCQEAFDLACSGNYGKIVFKFSEDE